MLNTRVIEVTGEGLRVSRAGKEETLGPVDTFVVALGAKPNRIPLSGSKANIHYIGDCSRVGNAMDAIHEAFRLAVRL